MFGIGMPELLVVGVVVIVALVIKKNMVSTDDPSRNSISGIDASLIDSITIEGACPDCHGQNQVWCKVRKDTDGNAYIYHNKCGWGKNTGEKWEEYVAKKISEGYINYTKRTNLIAPWDIRPGMEKILIGNKK